MRTQRLSGLGARPSNTSPFLAIYTHLSATTFLFFLTLSNPEFSSAVRDLFKMRWCLTLFICCFLAAVNALSSSGSRLLAVLEDTEQKDVYSTLWADLEGKLTLCSFTGILLTLRSSTGI
jgi:hypothetical protein